MHPLFIEFTTQLARSGGGGSSSGGGGGGGEVIALIGYFPSYYLGKFIKKLLPRTAELIVSGAFATFFTILLLGIGIFGGSLGFYFTFLIVVGIWAGWGAAFFGVWEKLKKRSQAARKTVETAGQTDAIWNEQTMLEFASQTFMRFQQDWSTFAFANFASYMTPQFIQRNTLLLRVLYELGRTNRMENVQIKQALIIDAHDDADDSRDSFTVAFDAVAKDQLIDNQSNTFLFVDSSEFTEYWTFVRNGQGWLLANIDQSTADTAMLAPVLRDFAARNNMYYSLDMGWLFLPRRGVLFERGKFGISDINNHVVGSYHDHLVQLYTYSGVPSNSKVAPYMVAQINLPKAYGGIVIRRRKNALLRVIGGGAPKGYQKYEFEWPDFNKRYDVYATDADRLATFELLNPGFMAYLYDNDPEVSIEVTDNIVYLYKTASKVGAADFEKMMTILLKSFKELQL